MPTGRLHVNANLAPPDPILLAHTTGLRSILTEPICPKATFCMYNLTSHGEAYFASIVLNHSHERPGYLMNKVK